MKKILDYFQVNFKVDFYKINYSHNKTMASEIKLMLQSDININTNSGNFKLNSGEKNLEGKERFFYQKMMSLL